jgi:dUTP pyrophosphatase
MQRIAKFEKVSFDQFKKDWIDTYGEYDTIEKIKDVYDKIKLPKRMTSESGGYDFFSPFQFSLYPQHTIKIPTGIRVKIDSGWVLKCYPRSGLGFKFRLQLSNSVGVIDGDYFYSDNEGHIFAKLINDNYENKLVEINQGDGFMQGIFVEFGITVDDDADGVRNGGFGSSTGK